MKSIFGFQFPIYVLIAMGGLYYLCIGNLIYEYTYLFNPVASRIVTIIYIVIFNIFFLLCLVCFVILIFLNPGTPP